MMPTRDELIRYAASPAAFRDALTLPSGRGTVCFADVMQPFQAKAFEALDKALLAVASPAQVRPKPSPR